MNRYLSSTPLVDFTDPSVEHLIRKRQWRSLDPESRIKAAYGFVKDEILFGYNRDDAIPASEVLADGYGQCNTKAILLMALLRSLDIPCRLRGFTIDKTLQKGAITGLWYRLSPRSLIHTWVELEYQDRWFALEGCILDNPYLQSIQRKYSHHSGAFRGYAIADGHLHNPVVEWNRNDTFIQKDGINGELGLYDDPDDFYHRHSQSLGALKNLVYRWIVRHRMNRNIRRLREGGR